MVLPDTLRFLYDSCACLMPFTQTRLRLKQCVRWQQLTRNSRRNLRLPSGESCFSVQGAISWNVCLRQIKIYQQQQNCQFKYSLVTVQYSHSCEAKYLLNCYILSNLNRLRNARTGQFEWRQTEISSRGPCQLLSPSTLSEAQPSLCEWQQTGARDEQKLQCVRKAVLSGREDIQDINFKER